LTKHFGIVKFLMILNLLYVNINAQSGGYFNARV
jgi:hypothetical protein